MCLETTGHLACYEGCGWNIGASLPSPFGLEGPPLQGIPIYPKIYGKPRDSFRHFHNRKTRQNGINRSDQGVETPALYSVRVPRATIAGCASNCWIKRGGRYPRISVSVSDWHGLGERENSRHRQALEKQTAPHKRPPLPLVRPSHLAPSSIPGAQIFIKNSQYEL